MQKRLPVTAHRSPADKGLAQNVNATSLCTAFSAGDSFPWRDVVEGRLGDLHSPGKSLSYHRLASNFPGTTSSLSGVSEGDF